MKCPCGSEQYTKRGYYRPRSNNYQPIPRYECKVCHKTFSRQITFALNLVAAKIRHDVSRMGRKTWVTTKKAERLQAHLDLYIAFNNGYRLAA